MALITECEAGFDGLAAAVIRQAAIDYRAALAYINGRRKSRSRYKMDNAIFDLNSCERFFMGEWFRALSGLDGVYIMNRIREEEAEHEQKTKKKSNEAVSS